MKNIFPFKQNKKPFIRMALQSIKHNYSLFATSTPLKSNSSATVVAGGKIASILQRDIIAATEPE